MSIEAWLVPGPLHAVLACVLVNALLWRSRRAAPAWLRACAALVLAWQWATATPALGHLGVKALEDRFVAVNLQNLEPTPSANVIVLASGRMHTPNGQVSLVLDTQGWERLMAGIALWRRVGGQLLLVGGPGVVEAESFAHLMRREALAAGVPASAVVTLGGSSHTFGDLQAVSRYMQSHQSGPGVAAIDAQPQPMWLVTSALHMPRAHAIARTLGLQVEAAPCGFRQMRPPSWRSWLPDNGNPALWRDALHEWLGILVYRWRGWIR